MSSYFALWRAILHVPFSPLPLQTSYARCLTCNALYVIASENTGTPRDTVYPWGKGINKQKTSIFAFSVKWLVKSAVYDAWQSPGREPYYKTRARYFIMGPNGILCTRWEKEYASVRQTFVACDDCLVKNEAYDAEKKAQTSKRVSIAAPTMRFQQRSLRRVPCMNFGKC